MSETCDVEEEEGPGDSGMYIERREGTFSLIWSEVEVVRRGKEGKASLEMEEEGRPWPRAVEEDGREELEAADAMKRGVMIVGATARERRSK